MLIYDDQSHQMYKNKGNIDKLTAKKSDIYGNSMWILQKNASYNGQFVLIDTSRAASVRIFAARISTAARRSSAMKVGGLSPTAPEWLPLGYVPRRRVPNEPFMVSRSVFFSAELGRRLGRTRPLADYPAWR
jgi:hypothetical protein